MATRPSRLAVQKTGRVTVAVDADIDAVWDVVRDVTRVGEWSHECVGASWIGDATTPTPGARFRGRNRSGIFHWSRACEIVVADRYEFVWRTVPSLLRPDSAEWSIALEKTERGTVIEQRFRVTDLPRAVDRLYGLLFRQHRDRTAALTADLRRIGAVAARAPRSDDGLSSALPPSTEPSAS